MILQEAGDGFLTQGFQAGGEVACLEKTGQLAFGVFRQGFVDASRPGAGQTAEVECVVHVRLQTAEIPV